MSLNRPETDFILPKCTGDVEILYRDDHLMIVYKPPFLMSQPARLQENKDSLIVRLRRDFPEAGLVHRLDLDTSGILIIPLTPAAHRQIADQFQQRLVHKTYIAVVDGLVREDCGTIDLPIGKRPELMPRRCVDFASGKRAVTHYTVLSRDEVANSTRLQLNPVTGRTHQLRLHTRELGHAILGCDMYASPEVLARSPRLLLHASALAFLHPASGAPVQWERAPDF